MLAVDGRFDKDCCAANFERTLFRDQKCVELANQFRCVRISVAVTSEDGKPVDLLAQYDLKPNKPAILLLDAESGLLHKQQFCANPPDYAKVMKNALALNKARVSKRSKLQLSYGTAVQHLERGEYRKAYKKLRKLESQKEYLMGGLRLQVEKGLGRVEQAAQGELAEAAQLEQDDQLLDALAAYKSIAKEFIQFSSVKIAAKRKIRSVSVELKRRGVVLD